MFLKREHRRTNPIKTPAGGLGGRLSRFRFWQYLSELFSRQVEATELHLPVRGLPAAFAGYRLVQLSDIHIGSWINRERLDQAVALAISLQPDVFLLTGDYLPGYGWSPERYAQLADLSAGLQPLTKTVPTFSILGNHDIRTSRPAVQKALAGIGVIDLTNTVYALENGQAKLYLAGVDDMNAGHPRLDLVIEQLSEAGPAILLAHEPDFADISAKTGCFALQISGHTHGGQVVLPFIGPPLLPINGRKYPSGLYKVGEMYQYTNRGIGSGWQHLRFNCRPEITLFVLEQGD